MCTYLNKLINSGVWDVYTHTIVKFHFESMHEFHVCDVSKLPESQPNLYQNLLSLPIAAAVGCCNHGYSG